MRIRRRAGNQATVHQVLREIVTRSAVQARRVDLGQAATLDPAVQDVPVAADIGIALDMGKDGDEALQLQLEDNVIHVGGQVFVGQFKQEMCAPVGEGQDVAMLHPVGQVGADQHLVAWQDREGNGPTVQLGLQVPGSPTHDGGVRLVLVLDPMRRADDTTDAGCDSETCHGDADGHVRRTVVQPRKDVTVYVDDAHDWAGASSGLEGSVL